jgi:hypothetical protein
MNPIIKNFEALCYRVEGDYQFGAWHTFEPEKFAKLIIQECINIINKETTPESGVIYAPDVIYQIHHHFGIE